MKVIARTKYTVNNGPEQTKDIEIDMPNDFVDDVMGRYVLASKAADALVEEGQIMVSGVEVMQAKTAQDAA
jgi:hypothetical protein